MIHKYVEILQSGDLVVIPTETVYGLAADATNESAVAKIFTLKGRPSYNPLISHVCSMAMAENLITFDQNIESVLHHFWFQDKRPLTIVGNLKADAKLAKNVTAGLKTAAIRMPHNTKTLELIQYFNKPIAAPSANPSLKISPTCPTHLKDYYGAKCPPILEDGQSTIGLESTIVDLSTNKPSILRLGGVLKEEIEEVLGINIHITEDAIKSLKAPGMMKRHYAPDCCVILNADSPPQDPDIAYIGFGAHDYGDWNLSKSASLSEAARNLYAMMMQANATRPKVIHIAPIPFDGIGYAINDRLKRAAQK